MLNMPLLEVNVSNSSERGLLGIAVAKEMGEEKDSTLIYLHFTEVTEVTEVQDGYRLWLNEFTDMKSSAII